MLGRLPESKFGPCGLAGRESLPWLPEFPWHNIPKWGKYTKLPQNIPNYHKIYQMTTKYTKWPQNKPTLSITRPSKIYPNWDFWFENIPYGNPGAY
jgi:hypothetical protein